MKRRRLNFRGKKTGHTKTHFVYVLLSKKKGKKLLKMFKEKQDYILLNILRREVNKEFDFNFDIR